MKRTDVLKLWPFVLYPKSQDIKNGSFLPKHLSNHHAFPSSRSIGSIQDVQMAVE